ncbi:hypothetical protein MKMG_01493 [Methanogenium sp. MK-MG]|nr:hypothetical protein MKMG_01493 [Methanogenium sp. MK-MG]
MNAIPSMIPQITTNMPGNSGTGVSGGHVTLWLPFLTPRMGESGGKTGVFSAFCYCRKNTDSMPFIRSNTDLLQTIEGSLLSMIWGGCMGCLRLRTGRSGLLCGCNFTGFSPFDGLFMRFLTRCRAFVPSNANRITAEKKRNHHYVG